ncbi:MAG: tRNA (adenosine(37)-N6)-threonylcarbamoyltransferase complex ATPase subunit type 1 TsaE, partial [Clostridium perfringens]|nr:tRNA (adenosine(37)-N6)-threonylcarbamoyltransferase complex ATPase subunit type 1 TsaE [Clostridium perfringens]
NEYHSGRLTLYHFDVYRVNDPDEIEAIGFDEYIFGDGVSLIEWANYIEELIPEEYIHIKIEKLPDMGENFRKISINGYGDRYNYIKEIE